ncbi:MAG: hypothetical protein JWQ98_1039 [Chlorobi bacterium]|nr:hypothetical protein [Chlorobiota bacterium]
MGKNRQRYKRNHHFIPRLYLRGFTEPESPSMLWVYEHGRTYAPGIGRLTSNPYYNSISKAGMEQDHYAFRRDDGTMDYETFENALEKKEKSADRLIEKIRGFLPLNEEEKLVLAQYMIMMHKRVPKRAEEAQGDWPEVVEERAKVWTESFNEARRIRQAEGNENALQNLDKLRMRVEEQFNLYREGMTDGLRLAAMLRGMPMTQMAIASMRWQYFKAPHGTFFVTNNNPVFRFKSLGLSNLQPEITFPISSSVAIVGSWYLDMPELIRQVSSGVVQEINRRTCFSTYRYVYARAAHKQVYDLVQDLVPDSESKLSVLYDYILPATGLPTDPDWVRQL